MVFRGRPVAISAQIRGGMETDMIPSPVHAAQPHRRESRIPAAQPGSADACRPAVGQRSSRVMRVPSSVMPAMSPRLEST